MLCIGSTGAVDPVDPQALLHLTPQLLLYDRFVQAIMDQVLVADLANVDGILQQGIERTPRKMAASDMAAFLSDPVLGRDIGPLQFILEGWDGIVRAN